MGNYTFESCQLGNCTFGSYELGNYTFESGRLGNCTLEVANWEIVILAVVDWEIVHFKVAYVHLEVAYWENVRKCKLKSCQLGKCTFESYTCTFGIFQFRKMYIKM